MSEAKTIDTASAPVVETRNTAKYQVLAHDYPIIDNDPHIWRAIRYMRPWPDYAYIVGGTLIAPFIFGRYCRIDSQIHPWERYTNTPGVGARHMRIILALSFTASFFFSYQNVCKRLLGLEENEREYYMDMREMKDKIAKGVPLYGESTLSEDAQFSAANTSRYSYTILAFFPWFNFVNHNFHGVDPKRYHDNEPWRKL